MDGQGPAAGEGSRAAAWRPKATSLRTTDQLNYCAKQLDDFLADVGSIEACVMSDEAAGLVSNFQLID